jgi:hypothetical protein
MAESRTITSSVTGSTDPQGGWLRWWWILGGGLVLYLMLARTFFGVTADDAYISFRYAQNWAEGCGPVYSCGEVPVEGYTNFLWMALSALAISLGLNVVTTMRVLGLVAGGVALVVLALLARRVHGRGSAVVVPLLGMAASPFWAVNSVVGLETTAATLSVLVAALFSLDLHQGRRSWRAGIAWGLSYLVRPEAMGFATLAGLWSMGGGLVLKRGLWPSLRSTMRYAAGYLSVAGPYFAWRMAYYGDLVPNTFHAKSEPLAVLLPRNLKLLGNHWLFFVTVLALALAVVIINRRGRLLFLLLLALAAGAISLSVHNNFWMPGHRLFLTSVALLLIIGGGVADLGRGASRRLPGLAGPALVALACGILAWTAWTAWPETKKLADYHYAGDNHPAKRMGLAIRKWARPGDWLVVRDAGMVPFYAGPGVKALDMHDHSLNDRRIAVQGWDLGYVMGHRPRFIVFASHNGRVLHMPHPVERRLHASREFKEGRYRQVMVVPWHSTRHFYLFRRD